METYPEEPIVPCDNWANVPSYGLTKRELFAAMAMQGLLPLMKDSMYTVSGVIQDAVNIADNLIDELNKEKK